MKCDYCPVEKGCKVFQQHSRFERACARRLDKWKAKQMSKDAEDYGIHVPPSPCDFCEVRDCQKCLER